MKRKRVLCLQHLNAWAQFGGCDLQPNEVKVTVDRGIPGKDDATMPGRGKVEVRALFRMLTPSEIELLQQSKREIASRVRAMQRAA